MSGFILALLQLTFIMVTLLLLHRLMSSIGKAPFYIVLGMFFVFGQIISASGLELYSEYTGFAVNLGHGVLLAPFLATLLVVYTQDGTLEAQRLILGCLAVWLGYYYLTNISVAQVFWQGYAVDDPETVTPLIQFFYEGRDIMTAAFAVYGIGLFTLPVIYQIFRNWRLHLFLCVLATLFFAQLIDVFVFELLLLPEGEALWERARATYIARGICTIWLSVLVSIYFYTCRQPQVQDTRRPLDILLAFLGGYQRAKLLQRHLREWEGRYQLVVEHSNDAIFVVSAEGAVLSVNNAGARLLERDAIELHRSSLPEILEDAQGERIDWESIWHELEQSVEEDPGSEPVVRREWKAQRPHADNLLLEAQVSAARLSGSLVAIVIARDITERRRMERERQELKEQLIHSQRLEALGHLAGGVAHDFNNMLHAMRGSTEALDRDKQHLSISGDKALQNIETALDRASTLTSQLLGFARRGKYRLDKLAVENVLNETNNLFAPVAGRHVSFKVVPPPTTMFIQGDATQLQQSLINILINARDAIEESGSGEGRIVLSAEPAHVNTPGWEQCPESDRRPEEFVCMRVKDNGPGIPPDVRSRVFDPFFTTKPVGKGTGMGLAMVYGCVASHEGWVHVTSEEGKGTEFLMFLPLL